MAEGVDYSFARPSPAGLYAAGKRFAGRYIGPGSGKLLTSSEANALFSAGLSIFLLVEGNANDAAQGYSMGVSHAQSALNAARALGVPNSCALYFAVDYDVSSKGWDAPREYLRGAGSVIGPGRVGVYGEYDVMVWAARDGVAAWFFQTYAWSSFNWYSGNHVEQYLNGQIVAGGEVDLCRNKRDNFGQWGVHQEDGMSYAEAQNAASLTAVGSSAYGYPQTPKAEADAITGYNLKSVEGRLTKAIDAIATEPVDVEALATALIPKLTPAIREIVREELDLTKLGRAD